MRNLKYVWRKRRFGAKLGSTAHYELLSLPKLSKETLTLTRYSMKRYFLEWKVVTYEKQKMFLSGSTEQLISSLTSVSWQEATSGIWTKHFPLTALYGGNFKIVSGSRFGTIARIFWNFLVFSRISAVFVQSLSERPPSQQCNQWRYLTGSQLFCWVLSSLLAGFCVR